MHPEYQTVVGLWVSFWTTDLSICSLIRGHIDFLLRRSVALSATPKVRVTLDGGADEKEEQINMIGRAFS